MKTSELREMDKTSLEKELLALLQEQFNLRMQKATGQLKQTHLIANVKRNVAKVKTVLGEK